MTPRQADKAIKSGKPVMVRSAGETFVLTITSRDRRMIDGYYEWNGKIETGRFHRADLEIV